MTAPLPNQSDRIERHPGLMGFFKRKKAAYQAFVEKQAGRRSRLARERRSLFKGHCRAVIRTRIPGASSLASIRAVVKVSTFQNRMIRQHLH